MAEAGRSVAVTPALQALLDAVQAFRRRTQHGRTPAQLGADLVHLRHATDLLELEFSAIAGAFAETEEYDAQGSTTPIEWIRHHCKMTGRAAADRVNVGQQLAGLPQSAAAVVDGAIGFAHLSVIARTAAALRNDSHAFAEAALLTQARQVSVGRLTHLSLHVRHAADPDGVAAEQQAAVVVRRLVLNPMEDGFVLLSGQLDSAGAAAVRTALEPLARRSGTEDDRDYGCRMADALVELATHALDAGVLPSHASQRPHLQVSASLDTLRGLAGSPAGELELSMPIAAATVQRLACDSNVVRILLGPDSAILDVGRARRVVSAATRRALNARDHHCRWPGCDRSPGWSAAHHVVHWARGGKTDLDNLILLCHRHHWMVHEGGWELAESQDGEVAAFPRHIRYVRWDDDAPEPVAA